jgi:hypothetical protein
MHAAFDRASANAPNFIEFLLNHAPTLARYETAKEDAAGMDQTLYKAFMMDVHDQNEAKVHKMPEDCPECKVRNAWVLVEEDASQVCRNCGLLRNNDRLVAIPSRKDREAAASVRWRGPHGKYNPVAYLRKILNQHQATTVTSLDSRKLSRIRLDLEKRGLSLHHITPYDTHDTLVRLRMPTYYGHRWAITRRLNPAYQPLSISHELEEEIVAVFRGMWMRFPRVLSLLHTRRRHFLCYPLFVHAALRFLGHQKYAREFEPLKSSDRNLMQWHWLQSMFSMLYAFVYGLRPIVGVFPFSGFSAKHTPRHICGRRAEHHSPARPTSVSGSRFVNTQTIPHRRRPTPFAWIGLIFKWILCQIETVWEHLGFPPRQR